LICVSFTPNGLHYLTIHQIQDRNDTHCYIASNLPFSRVCCRPRLDRRAVSLVPGLTDEECNLIEFNLRVTTSKIGPCRVVNINLAEVIRRLDGEDFLSRDFTISGEVSFLKEKHYAF
jgi:hypothetical protein